MEHRYLNNYRLIFAPNWPSSMTSDNWKGWVYEHRYVMELHLGRTLGSDEEVHHLDFDPSNNHLSNLIVLSREDHAKLHQYLSDRTLGLKNCKNCNKQFKPSKSKTLYCSPECSSSSKRRCLHPSKEELKDLVWKHPFTKLGEIYGVSDNSIRKWCKHHKITDLPPKGFFLKKG